MYRTADYFYGGRIEDNGLLDSKGIPKRKITTSSGALNEYERNCRNQESSIYFGKELRNIQPYIKKVFDNNLHQTTLKSVVKEMRNVKYEDEEKLVNIQESRAKNMAKTMSVSSSSGSISSRSLYQPRQETESDLDLLFSPRYNIFGKDEENMYIHRRGERDNEYTPQTKKESIDPYNSKMLQSMSVPALKSYAKENGIKLGNRTNAKSIKTHIDTEMKKTLFI